MQCKHGWISQWSGDFCIVCVSENINSPNFSIPPSALETEEKFREFIYSLVPKQEIINAE